ncbi:hypothetical protein QBC46DRAFT_407301 [Diplogelasinospora grovesii]|uniref:Uncharacterized protein n=1 Tax=Diplogelasinospora grovesii TaxID=303347 RepID=A0AAN6N911_9PEZI|nr:hypothetical protein QBC46DRAFT_407301 [Diplogelasinospora grovesii]
MCGITRQHLPDADTATAPLRCSRVSKDSPASTQAHRVSPSPSLDLPSSQQTSYNHLPDAPADEVDELSELSETEDRLSNATRSTKFQRSSKIVKKKFKVRVDDVNHSTKFTNDYPRPESGSVITNVMGGINDINTSIAQVRVGLDMVVGDRNTQEGHTECPWAEQAAIKWCCKAGSQSSRQYVHRLECTPCPGQVYTWGWDCRQTPYILQCCAGPIVQ